MGSPLPNGTKLGRYEIRSQLGAGGMGEVYLCQDTQLRRLVALKVLPPDLTRSENRLHRFEQEAFAASALNHPNIITIHEIGKTNSLHYIVTEYVDGGSLRQHFQDARLKLDRLLDIAIQIGGALSTAHSAGIIHRDIKPENVMLRNDGITKVLDFGLAKLTLDQTAAVDTEAATRALVNTSAGVVMGTTSYMSPEQARGTEVDARTDIWSLGVVLYEMATGRLPFVGTTATEIIARIIEREPLPLGQHSTEVPAELERIVAKALEKDREDRYQTAKDLTIDLKKLKQRLEVESEIERTAQPESRNGAALTTASKQSAVITGKGGAPGTLQVGAAQTTSSAEYLLNGIKRHKVAVLVALLITGAAAIWLWSYLPARSAGVAIDSIAVLPFENRSVDPENEYLSEGLAESLIYRLSQLPNLRVSPTNTVFCYKGKQADAAKIGRELGVSAVLLGRITQRGDNLAISAELIDVRDNKLLWGEQYDRQMSDLLATQREMAREIVEKLKVRVSGGEKGLAKHYTESNEAYQLYLKGRFYWNKRSEEGFQKALQYFQQAIERDPNFALAYSGMADTYNLLGGPEAGGDMPPNEMFPKAKAAALKALGIDETLAEPHVSLAHTKYFYDRDWAGAEREFRRAIELNPNYSVAHHWYAIYLSVVGREREALAEIRRAQELDPLSLSINAWVGRILDLSGQSDQAVEQLRKTIEMDPTFILAHLRLGLAYEEKGRYDEAVSEFREVLKLSGGKPLGIAALAHAYASAGKREEAQKHLDELLQLSKQRYVSPASIGIIYVALGDNDRAFAWLEKADEVRDMNIVRLKVDPRFASLRSDPRFADLVRRVGLPQ